MALFDKSSVKKSAPVAKHRSTMGMLLNLDIAASINPLRDTVRMFVNLLAMIFAASGMFPRNHPAFTQDSVHLGLGEVMSRAWSSLRPSVADIPRYLLFFGVLSSLVFCGGAILIATFSLFLGQAHADTTNVTTTSNNTFFSPVDDGHDLALAWLRFLFQGQAVYNYLDYGQVVPQLTNIQDALMKALAFYADAILVVAAFILFYHLTTMIISTAHHGEFMGKKADKVWAPIRLVIALGLLVPVAGGLSSGQMIVVKVSEWGSNLASQTWNIFLQALVKDDNTPAQAYAPNAQKVVYDTVMSIACKKVYDAMTDGASYCPATNAPPALNIINQQNGMPKEPTMDWQTTTLDNKMVVNYLGFAQSTAGTGSTGTQVADVSFCGGYSNPPPSTDDLGMSMDSGRADAYSQLTTDATTFVTKYIPYFIPNNVGGCYGQRDKIADSSPTSDLNDIVTKYEQTVTKDFNGYLQDRYSNMMAGIAKDSAAQGWVSAGSWFNTIARIQGETARVGAMYPGTHAPEIGNSNSQLSIEIKDALDGFGEYINMHNISASGGLGSGSNVLNDAQSQLPDPLANDKKAKAKTLFGQEEKHYYDMFFAVMDWFAAQNGVWQTSLCSTPHKDSKGNIDGCAAYADSDSIPTISSANYAASSAQLAQNLTGNQPSVLGIQFNGANPLAQIVSFGQKNLKTSSDLFDDMMFLLINAGTAKTLGQFSKVLEGIPVLKMVLDPIVKTGSGILQTVGTLLATISGLMATISLIFFTCGFMLTFFLPMVPFLRFFFRSVAWFLAVLEAVIAIPLVALAHLNPEGEGLPGSAKHAYQMIFTIFLNPVLMVLGLIVGLLIFCVAAGLLNLLYLQAVVGVGGVAHHGFVFVSRFVYTILYVFALYVAVNKSFMMISLMPDQAARWMKIEGIELKNLGDPGDMETALTQFSTLAENKLVGQVSGLQGPAPVLLGEMLSPGSTKQATDGLIKVATDKKTQAKIGQVLGGVTGGYADAGADAIGGPGAVSKVHQAERAAGQMASDAKKNLVDPVLGALPGGKKPDPGKDPGKKG